MGLVNRVVAHVALEPVTEALTAQIAGASLSTLMATKTMLVRAWEQMGMRQHLQLPADPITMVEDTSDNPGAQGRAPAAKPAPPRTGVRWMMRLLSTPDRRRRHLRRSR